MARNRHIAQCDTDTFIYSPARQDAAACKPTIENSNVHPPSHTTSECTAARKKTTLIQLIMRKTDNKKI